jgi:predicted nuclease of predicted toxin-antitoxin system
VLLGILLVSRGFYAVTTKQAGNLRATDLQQLEYATASGLAIFTHNRADFESLADDYFASGKHHCGIIIAVRRQPHELLQRVLALLNRTPSDQINGNVWHV